MTLRAVCAALIAHQTNEPDNTLTDSRRLLWVAARSGHGLRALLFDHQDGSFMLLPNPRPSHEEITLKALRCTVKAATRRGLCRGGDEEDLVQDAYVHLLQNESKFDPTRASWSTFCSMLTRAFLYRRWKKRHNAQKSILDALQYGGAFLDDSQIVWLLTVKCGRTADSRAVVTIDNADDWTHPRNEV